MSVTQRAEAMLGLGWLEPLGSSQQFVALLVAERDLPHLWAEDLLRRGWTVLPVESHRKRPANACLIDGRWKPWQERRPGTRDLARWWPPHTDRGVGIVLPRGVACIDIEGRDGHPEVDAPAQSALLEPVMPSIVALPIEATGSGGRHLFGRLPNRWRPRHRTLRPEGIELRLPLSFVRLHDPSAMLPAPGELPRFPDDLLALFSRPQAAAPQKPIGDDELARWREFLPDLQWSGNAARARCPFHKDREPSLAVWRGREGRLRWACHANCPGSGPLHGGNLGDLGCRWRLHTEPGHRILNQEIETAWQWADTKLAGDARMMALAILVHVGKLGLDLHDRIKGLAYRRLARFTKLEIVPTSDRDAPLSASGARIKRALLALRRAGFRVDIGTRDREGVRGTATAVQFPAAALLPRYVGGHGRTQWRDLP